jgi:hypothetical protein
MVVGWLVGVDWNDYTDKRKASALITSGNKLTVHKE